MTAAAELEICASPLRGRCTGVYDVGLGRRAAGAEAKEADVVLVFLQLCGAVYFSVDLDE